MQGNGIVQDAKIIEVKLLRRGDNDDIKNKKVEVTTIHILVAVKIKPIIFSSIFAEKFVFNLHEDIRIDKYN